VSKLDLNRRSFLKTAAAMGVIASVRPVKDALAELITPASGQETHWISGNTLNYRRDGLAKVTGQKVLPSTCAPGTCRAGPSSSRMR
jgi:hypothetical protein